MNKSYYLLILLIYVDVLHCLGLILLEIVSTRSKFGMVCHGMMQLVYYHNFACLPWTEEHYLNRVFITGLVISDSWTRKTFFHKLIIAVQGKTNHSWWGPRRATNCLEEISPVYKLLFFSLHWMEYDAHTILTKAFYLPLNTYS